MAVLLLLSLSPRNALLLARKHNPHLLTEYIEVEGRIGRRFQPDLSLADVRATCRTVPTPSPVNTWHMA